MALNYNNLGINILSLLLISVIVKSTPVLRDQQKEENSTTLCTKRQQFYRTAVQLKNLALEIDVFNTTIILTENSTDMFNQKNVNLTMQQFSSTCYNFTTVMAVKHQLSYSLFNDMIYFNDSSTNITSNKGIRNLTMILEYLEKLACMLQDIEEISACRHCIVFNSDQYKKIYWNIVNEKKTSIFKVIVDEKWAKASEYAPDWRNNKNCAYIL